MLENSFILKHIQLINEKMVYFYQCINENNVKDVLPIILLLEQDKRILEDYLNRKIFAEFFTSNTIISDSVSDTEDEYILYIINNYTKYEKDDLTDFYNNFNRTLDIEIVKLHNRIDRLDREITANMRQSIINKEIELIGKASDKITLYNHFLKIFENNDDLQ